MDLTDPTISSNELLEILKSLPAEVDESLRDLGESTLDRSRAAGAWTIREIVHHIVDSASMATHLIRLAIAAPGSRYDQTWYDMMNRWATTLDYRRRSIDPSARLFRATCEYLIEMLVQSEEPWSRDVVVCTEKDPEGRRVDVRYLVRGMAWHVRHHLAQINETRSVIGE